MLAYIAKRGIAHIFHRGQKERECRNLYIADVYHDELANLHTYFGFVYMMKNYRKFDSPWSQLGLFLGLLGGAWILTILLAGIILFAKTGMGAATHGIDLTNPALTGILKVIQGVATVTTFALPAVLFAYLTFRQQPAQALGFRKPGKPLFFLLAVVLLFVAFPMQGWLGQINKAIPLPGWMNRMEEDASKQIDIFLRVDAPIDVYINLFVIALLPAICEELCFRGALQRILIQIFKSPWKGIVATGIFFSAFHMQFQGFLPRMFLGILLGAIYWYSSSIWVSILAHFFYNGIQVIAVSFYPKMIHDNPFVPVYLALISLVMVIGLVYLVRNMSETTYDSVYEPEPKEYDGFLS